MRNERWGRALSTSRRSMLALSFAWTLAACGGASSAPQSAAPASQAIPAVLAGSPLSPSVSLPEGLERRWSAPGVPTSGIALVGERVFVALPRWGGTGWPTVAEFRADGSLHAWPSVGAQDDPEDPGDLRSVNGLASDSRGRIWMVDNARVDLRPASQGAAKVVVWDTARDSEAFRWVPDADVAPAETSFLNDIAIDEPHAFAYLSDTGMPGEPAIIVWDWARDRAWRALEGDTALRAEPDRALTIDGEEVRIGAGDAARPWRVNLNAIAWDAQRDVVVFGATSADAAWEIDARLLRDPDVTDDARRAALRRVGSKPACDGMTIAPDGSILWTDVEAGAISRGRDGAFREMVRDPLLAFPVAIEVAPGGDVWFTTNELHRMPWFQGGVDRRVGSGGVWRLRAEVAGVGTTGGLEGGSAPEMGGEEP